MCKIFCRNRKPEHLATKRPTAGWFPTGGAVLQVATGIPTRTLANSRRCFRRNPLAGGTMSDEAFFRIYIFSEETSGGKPQKR